MNPVFIAAKLFALVLYALPRRFRYDHGAQMRRDFREALQEQEAARGLGGALLFATAAYMDVLASGFHEYAGVILRDFIFAARSVRKAPLFAFVVVATLAVAIGANATAFSILRGVVLAPLPYGDPSRLVSVTAVTSGKTSGAAGLSIPDFLDLRAQNSTLSSIAAYSSGARGTLTGQRGNARSIYGIVASPDLFAVLGTKPLLGRTLSARDARLGAPPGIVISHELWTTYFRSDPNIVGKDVRVDDIVKRVVGIMPADFKQPGVAGGFEAADFWITLQPANPMYVRSSHYAAAVGRLRGGVTIAAARADLDGVVARLRARYPLDDAHSGVDVRSLHDALLGSVQPLLFAMFAAVGGVLLVACANVANLLLSRAATRERELAIRAAVGASRRRILTQLLTETLVFTACGGLIGFLFAYLAVGAFAASHPAKIPRADGVTLDGLSALYTLGIVAICTLAAGVIPAFMLSSQRLAGGLRASAHGGDADRGGRARATLVATEVALTLALVVASGLIVRSYLTLTQQTLGFSPQDVLVSEPVAMFGARYNDDRAALSFYDRVMRRIRLIPGVRAAAWADAAPFMGRTGHLSFDIVGQRMRSEALRVAGIGIVEPPFFRVLGIGVLRGRTFRRSDGYDATRVVVVNAALARRYFPSQTAIGEHVSLNFAIGTARDVASKKPVVRTIVGVVADVRAAYGTPATPKMYLPLAQAPLPGALLVVKTQPRTVLVSTIASAVTAADPLAAAPRIAPLDTYLAADEAEARLAALALLALAFVAFVLAIAGVYAVVSYGVARRTHEFGIRIALGARTKQILGDVLVRTLRTAAIGIVAGIALAAFAAKAIADQLYGIRPFDPLTFGAVIAAVALAAAAAAVVPALRATRVDPIVALRHE